MNIISVFDPKREYHLFKDEIDKAVHGMTGIDITKCPHHYGESKYFKWRRDEAKRLGLCIRCRKRRATLNTTSCEMCRIKLNDCAREPNKLRLRLMRGSSMLIDTKVWNTIKVDLTKVK